MIYLFSCRHLRGNFISLFSSRRYWFYTFIYQYTYTYTYTQTYIYRVLSGNISYLRLRLHNILSGWLWFSKVIWSGDINYNACSTIANCSQLVNKWYPSGNCCLNCWQGRSIMMNSENIYSRVTHLPPSCMASLQTILKRHMNRTLVFGW